MNTLRKEKDPYKPNIPSVFEKISNQKKKKKSEAY